jgi:nucleotide-binding universal stress UspA family protein
MVDGGAMSRVHAVETVTLTTEHSFRIPLHLLVGATGEESSTGALHVASEFARRSGATVRVVTVSTPFPHAVGIADVTSPPMLDEENRRAALGAVKARLEHLPAVDAWNVHAVVGWPSEAIVDEAERWPASLIILGKGAHHAWDRLFGPETALAVARHTRAPVLAVAPAARTIPSRVLAAIDFTKSSTNAAKLAARLMSPDGVLVLANVSPFDDRAAPEGSLADLYDAGVADKLEACRREVQGETGRNIQTALLTGEIVDQLVRYADGDDCDLIAVGGQHRGFVDRVLVGSVRSGVLRSASCSVLIGPQQAAS